MCSPDNSVSKFATSTVNTLWASWCFSNWPWLMVISLRIMLYISASDLACPYVSTVCRNSGLPGTHISVLLQASDICYIPGIPAPEVEVPSQ